MDYKINELAKILDVSSNTIRRYETMGYIKPKRIAKNGYRMYGNFELDRMIWTRMFRKYDFSHEAIYEMLKDDFDFLIDSYEKKSKYFDEQIEYLKSLKNRIDGNIRLMKICRDDGYNFHIMKSLSFKYVLYSKGETLFKEKERMDAVHEYMNVSPESQLICSISKNNFEMKQIFGSYGIGVKTKDVERYNLIVNKYVEEFPSTTCLSCVIKVENELNFETLKPVYEYMSENNLKLTDDILGLKMAMIQEGEKNYHYIVLFIPIDAMEL